MKPANCSRTDGVQTVLTDADLRAMRDEIFNLADAMPHEARQRMYDAARFTGFMNALDPVSPHCTRDPKLAAEFVQALKDEIDAYGVASTSAAFDGTRNGDTK